MGQTYKQPEYAGGRIVKAKDVPAEWHSIHTEEEHMNEPGELCVLTHENSSCSTRKEIDKKFNAYRTKADANKALSKIRKILRGNLS